MDLSDYFQENKRFVNSLAAGLILFLIGMWVVNSIYRDDVDALVQERRELNAKLGAEMYSAAALDDAELEGEALDEALTALRHAVLFEARPPFQLRPDGGSPSSQYLHAVNRVREELETLSDRVNMRLDTSLGLPELSPTAEADVVRYLEALDLVESAVRLAIASDVERIDEIRISLDPAMGQRAAEVEIELTRVSFTMSGASQPLVSFLARTQRYQHGPPALVLDLDMQASTTHADEARMELTLGVGRVVAAEIDETEVN